jgi:dTDP-4-dehydrorhamnose reductase
MSRILLFGAEGQVGRELQRTLAPLGKVWAVSRSTADLTKLDRLKLILEGWQPQIIVNAAAYTAVDRAEQEPDRARQVNQILPTALATWAQTAAATLVHFSTDYVFDGTQTTPYQETDLPHPLSVYGESKWQGELGIQRNCDRYLIIRTAWVYGVYGKGNFVKTMLRLGGQRPQLRVVADQIGSPTWAFDLAQTVAKLLHRFQPDLSGIYHFSNQGVISWYDFAIAIFAAARPLGFPLQVEQVLPISSVDYPTLAQRPAYSVLDGQKIATLLGEAPPDWQPSLSQMLSQLDQTCRHPPEI